MNCFKLIIFAMVDVLHKKTLEYSIRENSEKKTRSIEWTLEIAMELLIDVYLQFLKQISQGPGCQTF